MTDPPTRLSPLFTWRSAIQDSGLPPDTRHVALSLSLHMNERGGSCFPSLDTLRKETGRRKASVIAGLGLLEQEGWLQVQRGGGRGKPNRYTATVPPTAKGTEAELFIETVPEAPHSVPDEPAKGTHAEPGGRTTLRTSKPEGSSLAQTPKTMSGHRQTTDSDFDAFWKVYPRRVGKLEAQRRWKEARQVAPAVAIIEGAVAYAMDPNREAAFTAHPSTWLRAGRWDDDPLPARLQLSKHGVTAQEMAERALESARTGDDSGPVGVMGFIEAALAAVNKEEADAEEASRGIGGDHPRGLPEPRYAGGNG